MQLQRTDAISKCVWDLYVELTKNCEEATIATYYLKLKSNNKSQDIAERKNRLTNATTTIKARYFQLTNLRYCNILYSAFVNERDRIVITRWRLSCHKLRVETGRYEKPKLPREERLCSVCLVLEDERHALFFCKCHLFLRLRHSSLIEKFNSVAEILHPNTTEEVTMIARYLRDIEENMKKLKLVK